MYFDYNKTFNLKTAVDIYLNKFQQIFKRSKFFKQCSYKMRKKPETIQNYYSFYKAVDYDQLASASHYYRAIYKRQFGTLLTNATNSNYILRCYLFMLPLVPF